MAEAQDPQIAHHQPSFWQLLLACTSWPERKPLPNGKVCLCASWDNFPRVWDIPWNLSSPFPSLQWSPPAWKAFTTSPDQSGTKEENRKHLSVSQTKGTWSKEFVPKEADKRYDRWQKRLFPKVGTVKQPRGLQSRKTLLPVVYKDWERRWVLPETGAQITFNLEKRYS
jgi:hypothetical protein